MCKKIIHCLNWKLKDIEDNLELIRYQGFTTVLTSVLQGQKDNGEEWWKCYQPLHLEVKDNRIGNYEELKSLCRKANDLGLEIMVDCVFDHVADSRPNEFNERVTIPKEFQRTKEQVCDWHNRWQVTHLSSGNLPHLNYDNEGLQDLICKYVESLVTAGVKAIRIDQCKHIALPNEGSSFFRRLLTQFASRLDIYGEVIFETPWKIDDYAKYIIPITETLGNNYNQCLFFESHDVYYSFGGRDNNTIYDTVQGYKRCVLADKYAALFFPRPFDNTWQTDEIREINKLR